MNHHEYLPGYVTVDHVSGDIVTIHIYDVTNVMMDDGSGVGSSATNLEQLTSGAQWLAGKRLNGNDSQETVMEWVNGLGLNLGE